VLSALTDLINAAGAVTRSTDWTAYGMVRTPVGAPTTATGPTSLVSYAGLPTGGPGGTYPARDRFHTPATGRWTSTDPATTGPGSGTDPTAEPGAGAGPGAGYDSPYTYAADRPTVYVDPLGDSVCEHLSGLCGSPTFAWNEVIGAGKVAQGIAGSALHPLRTHQQVVDTCDAGFDRWSGASGATWTGLAQCLDDLNPVAGIRRDLHTSLTNPCTDQSGQAFGSALLNTGLTATALKTGAAAALKTRRTPTAGAAPAANSGRALVDASKYDHLFGNVTSNAHNAARSTQNAQQLARIGVHDNAAGRSLLSNHFDDVIARNDNIARTFTNEHGTFQIRDSLFSGPGGFLKFESTWQVTDNGLRLTTVPMGG
jgi:hypothetical protein